MYPQLLLRQLPVRTVAQWALSTKKKETHLSVSPSNSQTWQDLHRAFGFLPTAACAHERILMQILLSVLSRTQWIWTKVQTKPWNEKKGIAKGNERARKTAALGFLITFWRSCVNFSYAPNKARECMFWGKQAVIIQNTSLSDGKTEQAFACLLPKTKASQFLRRLGSQNTGYVLKPGCLTLGVWKAVWRQCHFVSGSNYGLKVWLQLSRIKNTDLYL